MRIEIELHEAQAVDGEAVRIRIVRERRDVEGMDDQTVTLVRDHDRGTELRLCADGDYEDGTGKRFRLLRRLV